MKSSDVKAKGKRAPEAKLPIQKTTTIRQKEFISARPVEIYDALLNEQKHSAFTGARATCDRRVGGRFTAWDGYISGKNIKLENGRRIVQEWKTTEWPAASPPSRLVWTFAAKRGVAEVTMVHSKVPASQAESYRQGWIDYYWTPLQEYFAIRAATVRERGKKTVTSDQ